MKYSQAQLGRVLVVRLEDGDILHACLEKLAQREKIERAAVILVGGADRGSTLVVGPRQGRAQPVEPMEYVLDRVHEVAGVGTIFPNADGQPVLHMHAACGREGQTRCGCVRAGVKIWQVGEAILFELVNNNAVREKDPAIGFELLNI